LIERRSLSEKLGLLRELALFAGLSDRDIEAIGHATTMTHCSRGHVVSPHTTSRTGSTSSRRARSASIA